MVPASASPSAPDLGTDDVAALDRMRAVYGRLRQELARVIIGQEETIERLTICLFARGTHCSWGCRGSRRRSW